MLGWNNPAAVQWIHAWLEAGALLFFAALVVFDVLAHLRTKNEKRFEKIGLGCFAVAVLMEISAYPYGRRNDEFANLRIAELNERASIAEKTARGFEAQITDSNARVKAAEAQVASANAASRQAVATVATAEARIAEAKRAASEADARAAEARSTAEAERLERLRLEATVKPRSLSLDQQRQIADACRRFVGHRVVVASYGQDVEAAVLGDQIYSALRSVLGGENVLDNRMTTVVAGGIELGVHIRGPDLERDFISALGNALSSIGGLQTFTNDPRPTVGAEMIAARPIFPAGMVFVTIMVGAKPVPVLSAR